MIRHNPSDIVQRIEAQLTSGAFSSEADVLREAMNTLEHRQRSLQELRRKVQEADEDIATGRMGPFDAEQTKRNGRERLRQDGISD